MTMTLQRPEKFNIELAEKVLNHVRKNPARHEQSYEYRSCAQNGCLMGWAKIFNGRGEDEDASPGDLNLTSNEFHDIYHELRNDIAITKLESYIEQARAAQHPQVDEIALDEEPLAIERELVGV